MLGRVIQPGDLVTIQGVTGTVHDITWRQTVVRTRSGDMMVIPNSVLNTAALTKLTPVSEGMATLEFTAKASGDPSAISRARGCAAFHHQRYGGASHRRFGHRIPC